MNRDAFPPMPPSTTVRCVSVKRYVWCRRMRSSSYRLSASALEIRSPAYSMMRSPFRMRRVANAPRPWIPERRISNAAGFARETLGTCFRLPLNLQSSVAPRREPSAQVDDTRQPLRTQQGGGDRGSPTRLTVKDHGLVSGYLGQPRAQRRQRDVQHPRKVARVPLTRAPDVDHVNGSTPEERRGFADADLGHGLERSALLLPGGERVHPEIPGDPIQSHHRQIARDFVRPIADVVVDHQVQLAIVRQNRTRPGGERLVERNAQRSGNVTSRERVGRARVDDGGTGHAYCHDQIGR